MRDNEVLIVDTYTGRVLPGRRFSDGLHQAIEGKEGVRIQPENRTVATTTYQNFFNKYEKIGFISSKLSFSAEELADSMKKNGDVIANVAPGEDTIRYLEKRRMVMTALDLAFLLVIVLLPDLLCTQLGVQGFSFAGTSLIIVVAMLYDTSLRIRVASIHKSKKHRLFV